MHVYMNVYMYVYTFCLCIFILSAKLSRTYTLVLEALGQEFLFTDKGELWCHGKVDDVVDTKLPIALIYGLYKLGSNAETEINSGKAWKFELKASSDCVQCSSEVKKDACPEGLAPLSEILAALDNPKVECHDIEPKFTKDDMGNIVSQDYDIKCSKVCSFTPTKIPKEFNEDEELGAACKHWDVTARTHGFCCDFYVGHDKLQPRGNPQPHHPARHGHLPQRQSSATRTFSYPERQHDEPSKKQ